VVRELAEYLETRFGSLKRSEGNMPSAAELEEWISKHAKGARDRLTTAGIVSRIMRQARLFGAPAEHRDNTLARVDAVLARARRAERALRESDVAPTDAATSSDHVLRKASPSHA